MKHKDTQVVTENVSLFGGKNLTNVLHVKFGVLQAQKCLNFDEIGGLQEQLWPIDLADSKTGWITFCSYRCNIAMLLWINSVDSYPKPMNYFC